MTVIVATHNKFKFMEIKNILLPYPIHIEQMAYDPLDDVVEDGQTFKDNAILKAKHYALKYKKIAIADDSGLIVDQIAPLPGIYSKRYSGLGDLENNIKVLDCLRHSPNRAAYFVCVIAIIFPDGKIFTYEGKLKGEISHTIRGHEGFGYDPIFIPERQNKTLAELGSNYKIGVSHRRLALNAFLEDINEIINYWRHTRSI